jgi:hypothetical protein
MTLRRARGLSLVLIALASALAIAGCSGDGNTPDAGTCTHCDGGTTGSVGCTAKFSGDFQDSSSASAGCATLTPSPDAGTDAGPDWILQVQAYSALTQSQTVVEIDLGPTPNAGDFSSDTVFAWSSIAITPVGCEFSAGNPSSAEGNFQMTLTSISDLDAGSATVHGSLLIHEFVQAPAGTDCGSSNQESVDLSF